MSLTKVIFFPSTDPHYRLVQDIRLQVFVDEQRCPEDEEWDDKDEVADHFLATRDGTALGTLRFFDDDDGWIHIGRLAVLRQSRGLGIGASLMAAALREAEKRHYAKAFLNAQSDKIAFYQRFGFATVGDEFMEAGILHQRMEAALQQDPA